MHLLSYLLLQTAIAASLDGWMPIVLLVLSFLLLLRSADSVIRADRRGKRTSATEGRILLALLLFHAASPPLLYADPLMIPLTSIISFVLAALLTLHMIFPSKILERTFIASALTFAILLYLLVPVMSPSPRIDVFTAGQESTSRLLASENPYASSITDPYGGQKDFGYEKMPGYPYLPGSLLLQTVGGLFGDVRWVSVASMLLSAFLLWKISGSGLLSLLWLYQPRGLFVVEHAWVEPLMVVTLLLMLKVKQQGILFGLLLSLKQSLLFFLVHGLFLERRTLLKGIIVAAVIIVPFVLWDTAAFQEGVIEFSFAMGHRSDALTLPTRMGIVLPRLWTLAVGLVASLITLRVFRSLPRPLGFLYAATITTFAMYLLGSQAFVNYYFFVGGLLLSTVAITSSSHE